MLITLKSRLILVTAVVAACIGLNGQTSAQTVASAQVTTGVAWENFTVEDGPLNYNILRVNVADARVTLETESGHDALYKGEKVLATVKRETQDDEGYVVAGVNADFWREGAKYVPVGILVADGMIYRMSDSQRSAFVFTEDEKSFIGPVTLEVFIGEGTDALNIETINPWKEVDAVALFTPPYGRTVPAMEGSRYLLTMREMEFLPNKPLQVNVVRVSSEKETPLTPGTMVLHLPESGAETAAGLLEDGETYTLAANLPQVKGVVRSACGGGPKLVENGKPGVQNKKEGIGENFVTTKHPRTAIGFSKDQKNVFLVTVDGRQPEVSVGVDLHELADFMATLGCWSAMNLDGGGSTTMVVGEKVVNKPSDAAGPRTVTNSILVVTEMPPALIDLPSDAAVSAAPGQ